MIYFEVDKHGITQRLEGRGMDLLSELMLVMKAFKEENFSKEILQKTLDFVYSHDFNNEDDFRIDSDIDPLVAEKAQEIFDGLFGGIFKDKDRWG